MGTIRMSREIWNKIHNHLYSKWGEHFAFMLATHSYSCGQPVFMVRDALLISDDFVDFGKGGWQVETNALLEAINLANRNGEVLIEVHNHGGSQPRFSKTDREGFNNFVPYVLDSLPKRPYGATVWGDSEVYGEFYLPNGNSGVIRSILVIANDLQQVVSRNDDFNEISNRFNRQLPWFTPKGQKRLNRMRIAVIGCGGIGSLVIQQLAFLGVLDWVLIDDERADETNLNRLVTACGLPDIGKLKVDLGKRFIKGLSPTASVLDLPKNLLSKEAIDVLKGVDVVFGCVDNDGARMLLNELAVAYQIPFFDLASGITVHNNYIEEAGGRVFVVTPGGPCLICANELDVEEVSYFLASDREKKIRRERGYVTGMDIKAPSVIGLNSSVATAGVNEFSIFVSGRRAINYYTEVDLLGNGRKIKSQWMTPRLVKPKPGCVQCARAGLGDATNLERYIHE